MRSHYSQSSKSALINVMSKAVYKASSGLLRDFGELEHLQVSRKSVGDFVSSADQKSESILIEELTKARPKFGFICEESGVKEGEDERHKWIIDPLDGTSNFLHSLPYFAINVALEFDSEIIAAITYLPVFDELYWAEKGKGAYCNERRIRVANRVNTDEMLVSCEHSNCSMLTQFSSKIRYSGSAAIDLAYVACAKLDACFLKGLKSWDMASGILLLKEAGAVVSDFNGAQNFYNKNCNISQSNSIIAGSEYAYNNFIKILKDKSN